MQKEKNIEVGDGGGGQGGGGDRKSTLPISFLILHLTMFSN